MHYLQVGKQRRKTLIAPIPLQSLRTDDILSTDLKNLRMYNLYVGYQLQHALRRLGL